MINNKISLKKGCIFFITAYFVIAGIFYLIAEPQLKYKDIDSGIAYEQATTPIGEITKDNNVRQSFVPNSDVVTGISIMFATYDRANTGGVLVQLTDHNSGEVISQAVLDSATIINNAFNKIPFPYPIDVKDGMILDIVVSSEINDKNNAVTIWYNENVHTTEQKLTMGETPIQGTLCFQVEGKDIIPFGKYYWFLMIAIGFIISIYSAVLIRKAAKGKPSFGLRGISAASRYRFLLEQLVSRDFKTKYKRSVLGILWSFINPLLMMIVQYAVFVNLFRFDIENYAIYLLSGIIFFSFFSESTTQAMSSITGSASLITKVYVPKYIFPISKVLSSTINLLISVMPLALVIIFTGLKITWSILLLPFGIICMIVFSIGVSLILSSAMVFFRDTQFLWGVITTIWMYATPIIYPETILSPTMLFLMKFNPMYHFIRFNRIILLHGVSPEIKAYVYCIIFALGTLLIGYLIFRKAQDRFVLNI